MLAAPMTDELSLIGGLPNAYSNQEDKRSGDSYFIPFDNSDENSAHALQNEAEINNSGAPFPGESNDNFSESILADSQETVLGDDAVVSINQNVSAPHLNSSVEPNESFIGSSVKSRTSEKSTTLRHSFDFSLMVRMQIDKKQACLRQISSIITSFDFAGQLRPAKR